MQALLAESHPRLEGKQFVSYHRAAGAVQASRDLPKLGFDRVEKTYAFGLHEKIDDALLQSIDTSLPEDVQRTQLAEHAQTDVDVQRLIGGLDFVRHVRSKSRKHRIKSDGDAAYRYIRSDRLPGDIGVSRRRFKNRTLKAFEHFQRNQFSEPDMRRFYRPFEKIAAWDDLSFESDELQRGYFLIKPIAIAEARATRTPEQLAAVKDLNEWRNTALFIDSEVDLLRFSQQHDEWLKKVHPDDVPHEREQFGTFLTNLPPYRQEVITGPNIPANASNAETLRKLYGVRREIQWVRDDIEAEEVYSTHRALHDTLPEHERQAEVLKLRDIMEASDLEIWADVLTEFYDTLPEHDLGNMLAQPD